MAIAFTFDLSAFDAMLDECVRLAPSEITAESADAFFNYLLNAGTFKQVTDATTGAGEPVLLMRFEIPLSAAELVTAFRTGQVPNIVGVECHTSSTYPKQEGVTQV